MATRAASKHSGSDTKMCTKCRQNQPLRDYYRNKTVTASGYKYYIRSQCKKCERIRNNAHSKKPAVKRQRRERIPISKRPHKKLKTWDDIRTRMVSRSRELRNISTHHRVKNRLYRRMHHALKGKSKSESTFKLVGCTPAQLVVWIESQFTTGMTWDNVHIDHMMPCAKFNFEHPLDQQMCFHYTNLQPLFAKDNLKKHDHITNDMRWVRGEWFVKGDNGLYRSRKITTLRGI